MNLPRACLIVSVGNIILFESSFKRKMVMSLLRDILQELCCIIVSTFNLALLKGWSDIQIPSIYQIFWLLNYFHVCHLWLSRCRHLFLCILALEQSVKITYRWNFFLNLYFIDTRRAWIGDWNQIKRSSKVHF